MSRISTNQIFQQTQSHIAQAQEKENLSAERSTTLKQMNRPSQAPAEWVIASNLKDNLSIRETTAKDAQMGQHFLHATEGVLSQAQELTEKVHTLALEAASDSEGPKRMAAVLPEVKGLYENFIQVMNTRFSNRTLMAGEKTTGPAFDHEGNYLGDDGKIEVEVDRGLKAPVSLSTRQIILGEGLKDGVNIVKTLKDLLQGLAENNVEGVRASLGNLTKATDQLSLGRTQLAGSMTEISSALETQATDGIQSKDAISQIEEADPIKVFSDLARDQTVLRAAIDTSHKLLSETPSDILFK